MSGPAKYAVRVQLDPNRLMNRGIGSMTCRMRSAAHNANLPTGTLWGASQAFTVQANGQLHDGGTIRVR